jgi:transcriptional antiterminator Rof (Rho-off)
MPIVITPKPDQDQAPVVTVSEPEFEILNTYENLEIAALGNLPVVYKVKGSNEVVFAAAQLTNQENLTSTLEYENKNYDLNVDNLNLNTLKEKKYNKRAAKLPELETIRVNKKGKVVLIGKNLRNKANLTLVFEDGTDQLVNLKNLNRRKTRQKVKLGNLPADIKYFVYTHKKFGAAFAKYEADQ